MDQEELEELVARLEKGVARWPRLYRLRLALLGILGYAYILFVLLATLLLTWLCLVISFWTTGTSRIGIGMLGAAVALIVIVLRALWIRFPAIQGQRLRPSDAPELFACLADTRRVLRGPRIHRVLLREDLNAAIVQTPRLGVLGWPRNDLLIGLPILQAMSPAEFRAVLGHELGHLSAAHGRFGAWIYRVRTFWVQFMAILLASKHWGVFAFIPFFEWYVPYFGASSLVLARLHETRADRSAATLTTPADMASALIRLNLAGRFFQDQYSARIGKLVESQSRPPEDFYERLQVEFRKPLDPTLGSVWLREALTEQPAIHDTHPRLANRLTALGAQAEIPGPIQVSAADEFLGAGGAAWARRLSEAWLARNADLWSKRHAAILEDRQNFGSLEKRSDSSERTAEEEFKAGVLAESLHGADRALPCYQAAIAKNPDHAAALYAAGRILISRKEEAGAPLLIQASKLESDFVIPANIFLRGHFERTGEGRRAQECVSQIKAHETLLHLATEERSRVNPLDTYRAHGLHESEVSKLRDHLVSTPSVKEAYLVRKEVRFMPEKPFFVLGLVLRHPWYRPSNAQEERAAVEAIISRWPLSDACRVLAINDANSFQVVADRVPHSRIL